MPKARNINEQDLSMLKAINVNQWNAPNTSKIIGKGKKAHLSLSRIVSLSRNQEWFFSQREIGL